MSQSDVPQPQSASKPAVIAEVRRVLVVDKDEAHLALVVELIKSIDAEPIPFSSWESMLSRYPPGSSGCVIADTETVGLGGLDFLGEMQRLNYELPTILISQNASVPMAVRAMQAGAITVLEKPCDRDELSDAIRLALKQATSLKAHNARLRTIERILAQLTAEELEVMQLIVDGLPNKAIAWHQDVSVRTIEARRKQVFNKTGAGCLAELVRLTIEMGVYADSLKAGEAVHVANVAAKRASEPSA